MDVDGEREFVVGCRVLSKRTGINVSFIYSYVSFFLFVFSVYWVRYFLMFECYR